MLTITTGSGLVAGSAEGIRASTADGELGVTVGTGGVTSAAGPAVQLTSKNGNISISADGTINADSLSVKGRDNGDEIRAISKGLGGIVVDDTATIFAPAGRGIYAKEGPTGLGGILVTGTGDVIKGTSSSCCSGIKADIKNTADSSDVIVNWSGNVFDNSTLPYAVISGIHALTAGTGNVIVAGGSAPRFPTMARSACSGSPPWRTAKAAPATSPPLPGRTARSVPAAPKSLPTMRLSQFPYRPAAQLQ